MSVDFKTIPNTNPTHVEHHEFVKVDRATKVGTNAILNSEPKPKPLTERAITWIKTACSKMSNLFSRIFPTKKEIIEPKARLNQNPILNQTSLSTNPQEDLKKDFNNSVTMFVDRYYSEYEHSDKKALIAQLKERKLETETMCYVVCMGCIKGEFDSVSKNMNIKYGYIHDINKNPKTLFKKEIDKIKSTREQSVNKSVNTPLIKSRPESQPNVRRRRSWGSISPERGYLGCEAPSQRNLNY